MRFQKSCARPRVEPLEDRTLMSTCHVTRLTDQGIGKGFRGDLRYCINKVNAEPGPDAIDFTVTGTINLTSALPELASDIDIHGPGAEQLTIRRSGSASFRLLVIPASATVTIEGVALSHGSVLSEDGGAGILNHGNLILQGSVISENGIDCSTCDAKGGGIFNSGSLTVVSSTINNNSADTIDGDSYGGAIYNTGLLSVYSSTISGNCACWYGHGGAVFNAGGFMAIINSTIHANYTDIEGGAIDGSGGADTVISHSTIAANKYGTSGINVGLPHFVYMRNTIVAGNTKSDIKGALTSSGYNVVGNTTSGSGFASTDILNIDPLLGPLADNGGPTLTMALLPGSPAIDAGDNTDAPEWDQRGPGFPRIVNGTIDIGAFEVQATPIPSHTRPGCVLLALVLATVDLDALT